MITRFQISLVCCIRCRLANVSQKKNKARAEKAFKKWEKQVRSVIEVKIKKMARMVRVAADLGWVRDEESGETFWGTAGAGILFVSEDGRILLLKRSSMVDEPGTWGVPGGALQAGQNDPWKAALEETREETGLAVSGKRIGKYVFKRGGFTFTTFIVQVSADVADRMRPRLDWENTDWKWYDAQSIQGVRLHPGVKTMLAQHGDLLKAAA